MLRKSKFNLISLTACYNIKGHSLISSFSSSDSDSIFLIKSVSSKMYSIEFSEEIIEFDLDLIGSG